MGSGPAHQFEKRLRAAIWGLCFVDEREADFKDTVDLDRYGKLGVSGPFDAIFGDGCDYRAEVASVYAELLWRLGYLDLERQLTGAEWTSAVALASDRYVDHDVRLSEVRADLGEPSLIIEGRVLCYVDKDTRRWAFFDFWEAPVIAYVPAEGSVSAGFRQVNVDADPFLRCVRLPAPTFDGGLLLTVYGKVLRWGPGWWISHPPETGDGDPEVREMLGQIAAADPSQSLGPRRP